MKKILPIIAVIFALLTIIFLITSKSRPVTLGASGVLPKFSIDDLIEKAEIIVIGEVKTNLPSRWNGPHGNDPKNISPEEISRAGGLFTDSLISITHTLKGDFRSPIIRVRAFTGKSDNVIWVSESQPSYVPTRIYLLFLVKDFGTTAKVDPGDYIAVGSIQGVYEIIEGKAISANDEWVLEDLITYIQNALQNGK